ncbi:MAG: TatD family hydrolase [Candidatus Moranbacteria bacterium]|nr:TatD family hydrolase [Candidatus Moranbacteria bacterium]
MLDIHTHLYMPQYDDDRKEVIKRAFDVGLSMMVVVSTSPEEHKQALAVTEMDVRIFSSVGLHPHYFCKQVAITDNQNPIIDDNRQVTVDENQLREDVEELRKLAKNNPKIIAIGECGLDYFSHTGDTITDAQKAWQKEGFIAQIRLAQELHLPMIIHCRDAYEDLVEVIRREGGDTNFILHCYMGDTEVTRKFLEFPNAYFSFTGNITYAVKKSAEGTKDDIRETVNLIPLERMFIETDCPFLAPVPHRGKRNEPSFVTAVAKKIMEIKDCSQASLTSAIKRSVEKVFHSEI